MKISYKWLFATLESLNYKIFLRSNELNIVGIRRLRKANLFDDIICVAYFDESGKLNCYSFPATTEPGLTYLRNPLNKKGTAILAENQYVDTYSIDLHNGKYPALCQRLKPVAVFRDNNKDDKFDLINKESGMFGINIHRASAFVKLPFVDKNSAGCQVIQDPAQFSFLMKLSEKHKHLYGNKFTYTLINEIDLAENILNNIN